MVRTNVVVVFGVGGHKLISWRTSLHNFIIIVLVIRVVFLTSIPYHNDVPYPKFSQSRFNVGACIEGGTTPDVSVTCDLLEVVLY